MFDFYTNVRNNDTNTLLFLGYGFVYKFLQFARIFSSARSRKDIPTIIYQFIIYFDLFTLHTVSFS